MLRRFSLCALLAYQLGLASVQPAAANGVIGRHIEDFTLPDYLGREHTLSEVEGDDLIVVAFLGTECPLAKLYAGRLQSLADAYADQGVAFLAVASNVQDSLTEIAAYARRHGIEFPVLKDRGNRVADLLGAERTPEVFLLDRDRTVRYRGRIDDQFVVGIVRDVPTREDLREAIEDLLADREVTVASTQPLGWLIGRVREVNEGSPVTYSRHIARIFQKRCVECHRTGEIGPFALTSYEDAAGWGEMIAEVVRDRRMPPWHADPHFGSFVNDRSMSEQEMEQIFQWVENGCPEGDPSELPEPRRYTTGWQLSREPDRVVEMRDEPFVVPADAGPSGVPYQYFRVPSGLVEDTWIEAAEVQPGNRTVVHHIIVYLDPPGGERRRDWIFLTAYVPGLRYDGYPTEAAKLAPADSELVFEVHYTPVGSAQEDMSRLGLVFADGERIGREVITAEIGNLQFAIPPGDANHLVTATSSPIERDMTLLSMSPHMHLRGKAFRYELVAPDGSRETLLDVPAYDFNWQTRYVLSEPRQLAAGSIIHCRAAFDNSSENLANPDPTKTIRWGDQSWDEMMLGYFDVMLPREEGRRAGRKPVRTGLDLVGMFDAADADGDRLLSRSEVEGLELVAKYFAQIDRDQDEFLQLSEIIAAVQAMRRSGG